MAGGGVDVLITIPKVQGIREHGFLNAGNRRRLWGAGAGSGPEPRWPARTGSAATDDPRGTSDTTRRASTNGGVWKGTVPNPHIRSVTQYAVEALSHKSDSVAGCQERCGDQGFRDDGTRGRNLEHGCPLA